MGRFIKKPGEVEAFRYVAPGDDLSTKRADARTLEEWGAPVSPNEGWGNGEEGEWDIDLETPSGPVTVHVGDWVCRQPRGDGWDYWPVVNDQFFNTYEEAL